MILLDPQHTNFISYHKFLNLFEQRENKVNIKYIILLTESIGHLSGRNILQDELHGTTDLALVFNASFSILHCLILS